MQASVAEEDKHLSSKRFKQLELLLDQTHLYSKFLAEQMDALKEVRWTKCQAPG